MNREDNMELQVLSVEAFGSKYAYKKLMRKGIVLGTDKGTGVVRRMPLTQEQAKDYLIKRIEMNKKMKEDMEAKGEKIQPK